MKKKDIGLILMALTIFQAATVFSQHAFVASGGEASGNGTASYSMGQTVFSQNQEAGGFEIQGVQQPYEITIVSVSEQIGPGTLELSVFPNPTYDVLHLTIDGSDSEQLFYRLINMEGKSIQMKKIEEGSSSISMSGLPGAVYFLTVADQLKAIKTFRIIKN